MKRRSLLALAGLAPIGGMAASAATGGFTQPLRWAVRPQPTSLLVTEMSAVWQDQQGINESWTRSPDLRLDPYGIPPEAVAVLLTLKSKVLLHTTSPYACGGTIAHAVRAPGCSDVVNFCAHIRQEKPASPTPLTVEKVDYNTILVGVAEGRFELYTIRRITNHVLLTRDVFLSGYGVP